MRRCKGLFAVLIFLFFCTVPGYGRTLPPPPRQEPGECRLEVSADGEPGELSLVRVGPDGASVVLWRHLPSPRRNSSLS